MAARSRRAVTLVEVLLGTVILVIVAIGTLSYFAYGLGGIHRQGNRRAALERARQRLEELAAADLNQLRPGPDDAAAYWVSCVAGSCSRLDPASAPAPGETVSVNGELRNIQSTIQWLDEPSAGTDTYDTLELSVKVWFTGGLDDDDANRVQLRTLTTPT